MKLSARDVIDAPIEDVWAVLSDFSRIERLGVSRGLEVAALGGNSWRVGYRYRARRRLVDLRLTEARAPGLMGFAASGQAMEATLQVELSAIDRGRTRLIVVSEIRPRTLTARLFLQSLKLARGRVNARYQKAMTRMIHLIVQSLPQKV